ncbi:transposase family protein [Brasilonema sp. UFV-L1]|uniref:transposase family protein n=1 Tax=Brasilonema sp. UFV-L1 TaxID=2234130 RepID=UPI00145D2388|nr:transposase family protein [Brasilonema sp. UFV-L1]NMG10342.1 transposase family protein [Brasilonema sp. UFV-L1]
MNPRLTNLLNLPGVAVESYESFQDSVSFQLKVLAKGMCCPHCRNYTEELHQIRPIVVRDLPVSGKEVYLKLPRRQFYCRVCQRYVTERLQFIDWRRKYTQRYEENIYSQINHFNIDQVSQQQHLRVEQVKNIFNHIRQKRHKQHIELSKKRSYYDKFGKNKKKLSP